jgi:Ca2+-binding RTX toxin-like protein
MPRTLLVAIAALLILPSAASAATADADVRIRNSVYEGPVTFTAAPGETNRLKISTGSLGMTFRDSANPVHARGDCTRIDAHTARCPFTEDIATARLGDRDDRARVVGGLVRVRGGRGNDVLAGERAGDMLLGESGDDTLLGGIGSDELTGGPGRDRLAGGSGDDTLIDGETDAQAAPDRFQGGTSRDSTSADRGDVLVYSLRRRALRIDLGRGRTSTEDRIAGFESLIGGRGDDRLSGDADDNNLEGGPGDDVLHGRDGRDIPMGGPGDDRAYGDTGDDVVWGDAGRDRLYGGNGDDFVIGAEEQTAAEADTLACDGGDDMARSDGEDTLTSACERVSAFSNGLTLPPIPAIDADSADFPISCSGASPDGCNGTLALTGPAGEAFGRAHFAIPGGTTAVVPVALTPAGTAALRAGTVTRVDLTPDQPDLEAAGGYRAFIRGG